MCVFINFSINVFNVSSMFVDVNSSTDGAGIAF